MRCYAFVRASIYRYAWLIIFEIFRIFFFLDRGVGGWGVSYPNFFWIFIFFLYLQGPLADNIPATDTQFSQYLSASTNVKNSLFLNPVTEVDILQLVAKVKPKSQKGMMN